MTQRLATLCLVCALLTTWLLLGGCKAKGASESADDYLGSSASGEAQMMKTKGGEMPLRAKNGTPPPPAGRRGEAAAVSKAAEQLDADYRTADATADEGRAEPSRDAYYESNYAAGFGERQRVAELVKSGVVVDGKEVQLAAFTREYRQSFEIPTDRALALSAETEQAKVTQSGGRTYLQVGLQAIKREAPKRAPLNIAMVIDRSGSMSAERKLEFARKAAEDVVNRLASTDRLALVTYDEVARVDVPSTTISRKEDVLRVIRALQPGNSTNIHAGLKAGYDQVRAHLSADKVNTVILISDGLVTAGPSAPGAFRELVGAAFDDGIQTTTVGVGLDFAESLVSLIAREGKGNYHFVNEASAIQEIFDRELGDLTHVVAKAVNLRIVLDDDIRLIRVLGTRELDEEETARVRSDEAKIDRKVYEDLGITMDRQDTPDEPGVKMVVPHFYLGDSHVVLMEIEVPAGKKTQKVADVHLKYKDVVFTKNREEKLTATVGRAANKSDMVASTRQAVRKNRCGYETGEALLAAAQMLARGRADQAARIVDERMTTLGVAAREWGDEDIERDHALLGRYQEVLVAMAQGGGNQELGRYLAKSLSYSGSELTR